MKTTATVRKRAELVNAVALLALVLVLAGFYWLNANSILLIGLTTLVGPSR